MIIVLSPAKSLDYETPPHVTKHTLPEFTADSAELIKALRKLSPQDIGSLMHISDPLARLNFQRYADWSPTFSEDNSKQAMLAFNGDVYEGFDAKSLSGGGPRLRAEAMCGCCPGCTACCGRSTCCRLIGWKWARSSRTRGARILYAFWGDRITVALNGQMKKQRGASAC